MTGQRSPPVVRRVGMRNQQVGIKSGWLWVVYRLWCMNYYERVMLLPYVFRILPVAIFAFSSVHFTCATQGPHPFGAAAMMMGASFLLLLQLQDKGLVRCRLLL